MLQVTALHQENLPPPTPPTPPSPGDDPQTERPLPLAIQRLEGVKFRLGPEGAVIGCDRNCGIRLPKEAGTKGHHVRLEWCPTEGEHQSESEPCPVSVVVTGEDGETGPKSSFGLWDEGYFKLVDYSGDTVVLSPGGDRCSHLESDASNGTSCSYRLECLGRFVTATVEWTVKPLPICQYVSAKMFAAVKSGNLVLLEHVVTEAEQHGVSISGSSKNFSRTPSLGSVVAINFNAEEELTSDEEVIEQSAVYAGLWRLPGRQMVTSERDKRSLLHLAIECRHKDVVKFLLAKGAQVMHMCLLDNRWNTMIYINTVKYNDFEPFCVAQPCSIIELL